MTLLVIVDHTQSVGSDIGPKVHLMCGMIAAGKTVLAERLAQQLPAVRLSRDEWMIRLYGLRHDDPVYAERLEPCTELMWDVALDVLRVGVSVVLDWNHWNRQSRLEAAVRARSAGYDVVLHFLDVPLATVMDRARVRLAAAPIDAHRISEEGVRHFATIFEPPTADEGLPIIRHS